MIDDENQSNYETFRDCISGPVIQRLLTKPTKLVKKKGVQNRKNAIKSAVQAGEEIENEAEDLTDFVDV